MPFLGMKLPHQRQDAKGFPPVPKRNSAKPLDSLVLEPVLQWMLRKLQASMLDANAVMPCDVKNLKPAPNVDRPDRPADSPFLLCCSFCLQSFLQNKSLNHVKPFNIRILEKLRRSPAPVKL